MLASGRQEASCQSRAVGCRDGCPSRAAIDKTIDGSVRVRAAGSVRLCDGFMTVVDGVFAKVAVDLGPVGLDKSDRCSSSTTRSRSGRVKRKREPAGRIRSRMEADKDAVVPQPWDGDNTARPLQD
jgi:hypothetical protein